MKRLIVIIAVFAIFAALISCSSPTDSKSEHKVLYEVTGTKASLITVRNGSGGTERIADVLLPWKKAYLGFKKDHFVFVSAQMAGNGSISVHIYVDDKLYKSDSSSGAYVYATASGSF